MRYILSAIYRLPLRRSTLLRSPLPLERPERHGHYHRLHCCHGLGWRAGDPVNPRAPIYKPLDANRSEIRILEIAHANESDDGQGAVHCRLRTVSLDDDPGFYALSYLWGDPSVTADIRISVPTMDGDSEQSHLVPVTVNLASALSSLPSLLTNGGTLRLWADAICINQADLGERSSQVQLMRRIYETAEVVVAWLGDSNRINLGLDSLSILASECRNYVGTDNSLDDEFFTFEWLRRHPSLLEPSQNSSWRYAAWDAMEEVMFNDYWTRTWIFQEFVLARHLMLAGSERVLQWEDFDVIPMRRFEFRLRNTQKPKWVPGGLWTGMLNMFLPWTPADLTLSARRVRLEETMGGDPEDHTLLQIQDWGMVASCQLDATDPKDYVYGILGVCKMPIVPDYSDAKSAGDVYREFAANWLEGTRERPREPLEFLVSAGVGLIGHEDGFSSWTRNLRKATPVRAFSTKADWGVPGFGRDSDTYPLIQGKSLFVTGVRIDSVASIARTGDESSLLAYMADFISSHPTYIAGVAPLQAFVRLFAMVNLLDKDLSEMRAARQEELDTLALLVTFARRLGVDAGKNAALWNIFPQDLSSLRFEGDFAALLAEEFEGLMSRACFEMHQGLFVMLHERFKLVETESGYLGHAPWGVRQGDVVCVLNGISTPVILRKCGNHFIHVGTALVVGLMEGQAAGLVEEQGLELERFELR